MKTVLCYGDSNTWGWNPADGSRFPRHLRWSGKLGLALGPEVDVIEEGLSGRTTMLDDPVEGADKNGATYLPPCLASHEPIDLVILALGSNDLKQRFEATAETITQGMERLVDIVERSRSGPGRTVPKLLIVAPPRLSPRTIYRSMFEGAWEKLATLSSGYQDLAARRRCAFIDLLPIVSCESADGAHLEASEHKKICDVMLPIVQQLLA